MIDFLADILQNKVFKVVCDVIITLVIIFAIIITIISFNSNSKGISNIGGYIPLAIQSGSMEKNISKGDLIITKEVENYDDLKVGDVISFFSQEQETTIIKTHRIVEVYEEEGSVVYVTKGDANEVVDAAKVSQVNIISKWSGKKIPLLGAIITFLKSSVGFMMCIVFPLLVLFLYSLYNFVNLIIEQKKSEMYEQFRREQSISQDNDEYDDELDYELPKKKG